MRGKETGFAAAGAGSEIEQAARDGTQLFLIGWRTPGAEIEQRPPGAPAAGLIGELWIRGEQSKGRILIGDSGGGADRVLGCCGMPVQHLREEVWIARKPGVDQNLRAIASGSFDVALELGPACESGLAGDDKLRFAQREPESENLIRRKAFGWREVTGDADGCFEEMFMMGAQKVFGALALLLEIDL
jgi:hypothetical protein